MENAHQRRLPSLSPMVAHYLSHHFLHRLPQPRYSVSRSHEHLSGVPQRYPDQRLAVAVALRHSVYLHSPLRLQPAKNHRLELLVVLPRSHHLHPQPKPSRMLQLPQLRSHLLQPRHMQMRVRSYRMPQQSPPLVRLPQLQLPMHSSQDPLPTQPVHEHANMQLPMQKNLLPLRIQAKPHHLRMRICLLRNLPRKRHHESKNLPMLMQCDSL